MIQNQTILEKTMGRPADVKIKGQKLVPTVRVIRKADRHSCTISERDFDPRLHELAEGQMIASTEIPAPAYQVVRQIEMSRELLSSMSLDELRQLPQWGAVANPHMVKTQPQAVTELLIAAGLEERIIPMGDKERALLNGEAIEEEAPKPKKAPAKKAPAKPKSDKE